MEPLELRCINSLVKLLPGQDPETGAEMAVGHWSALRGEKSAIQLAVRWNWTEQSGGYRAMATLKIQSPVAGLEQFLSVRRVMSVPVRLPAYPRYDDNYLTVEPGLLPDLLTQLEAGPEPLTWTLRLPDRQWQVFWLEIDVPADQDGGPLPLDLVVTAENGALTASASVMLDVIPASLPRQELRRTEWFYADCLADYYHVPVFSEDHWQIIANFIRMAVDHGVNMLLTPLFTPPLDTAVGKERTTVQLVSVYRTGANWRFDFSLLKRWIDLAESLGVRFFEMSHLYTQWGAHAAPKILAEVDGVHQQVFGWETDAAGEAYRGFLAALLPELTARLHEWGLAGRCYFHVSDEPGKQHLRQYQICKDQIKPYLGDFLIIDALSDFDFYETGAVEKPIPANNHIEPFLEAKVANLWTYYCCGQYLDVSNLFMAMPSARNRILGVQLYLYDIEGFLHWGYNFYNNQTSLGRINPYLVNDADGAFPAGDAFLVYPGADWQPEPSIRLKVFQEGLSDLRALRLLESLTSRRVVLDLIQQDLTEPITFSRYPRQAAWIISLRDRINQAIADASPCNRPSL
jgi:hypothetical protein